MDDGFPPPPEGENGIGAPVMAEGESQELSEYPQPETIKLEEGENPAWNILI